MGSIIIPSSIIFEMNNDKIAHNRVNEISINVNDSVVGSTEESLGRYGRYRNDKGFFYNPSTHEFFSAPGFERLSRNDDEKLSNVFKTVKKTVSGYLPYAGDSTAKYDLEFAKFKLKLTDNIIISLDNNYDYIVNFTKDMIKFDCQVYSYVTQESNGSTSVYSSLAKYEGCTTKKDLIFCTSDDDFYNNAIATIPKDFEGLNETWVDYTRKEESQPVGSQPLFLIPVGPPIVFGFNINTNELYLMYASSFLNGEIVAGNYANGRLSPNDVPMTDRECTEKHMSTSVMGELFITITYPSLKKSTKNNVISNNIDYGINLDFTNKFSDKVNYNDILQDWKNGKELATIKCSVSAPIGDMKDEILYGGYINTDGTSGNTLGIRPNRMYDIELDCTENGVHDTLILPHGKYNIDIGQHSYNVEKAIALPTVFNVGDIVQPMVYTNNGDVPMSIKKDGSPKEFRVVANKINYDGHITQELTLQEV